MPRGVYGNARARVRVGEEPMWTAKGLAEFYEGRIRLLRIYMAARAAFEASRGQPNESQARSEMQGVMNAMKDEGLSDADANEWTLADWQQKAEQARHRDDHAGPPASAPAPITPSPPPGRPGAKPAPTPQVQPPPSAGPSTPPPPAPMPPPPLAPPDVHNLDDARNRMRFEWQQIPKKERSVLEVGAYAIGALAVTAVVIAIARR